MSVTAVLMVLRALSMILSITVYDSFYNVAAVATSNAGVEGTGMFLPSPLDPEKEPLMDNSFQARHH